VTFLHGSSTSLEVVAAVKELIGDRKALFILDSDHSKAHVLAEMEAYAPLVTPGSYMIVQDSAVNGHPLLPDFGPGPWEAIDEFLPRHPEFTSDRTRERLRHTLHPRGYLRKSDAADAG
jgi:cephalosporin hydroxylase